MKTISNSLYLIESINENPKFNRFIHFLRKQLVVIYDSLKNVILSKPDTIDVVFLCCYNFIEAFKKYYLRQGSDCRYYLGYDDIDLMRYDINNIEVSKGVPFVPQEHYEKPGIFHVYVGLLKDYFHISNEFDSNRYIIKCHSIRDLRNNYFHGDKKHFEVKELEIIIDLLLPLTNNIRE